MKETLGADTVKEVDDWVQEGLQWLEQHADEEKSVYDEKQKLYEDKIRPVMMKLYADAGSPGANAESTSKGPSVEEVD